MILFRRDKNFSLHVGHIAPWLLVLGTRVRSLAVCQDGIAMVMVLIAIMLISMLCVFGTLTGQGDLRIATNEQDAKRALDIADAGLRHAIAILGSTGNPNAYQNGFNDELGSGGTGGALAASDSTVVTLTDGNQYRFFHFGGSGTNDGYYVRAQDNYDDADQTTDTDQRIFIFSRGRVAGAEKAIMALLNPPVPCALTTTEYTEVSGTFGTSDLVLNTLDGNGACVATNANMQIRGNPSFPDGAIASGTMDCQGSASILGGGCEMAQQHQPRRAIPLINAGLFAQWVAALGTADSTSPNIGPYYILHTRATPTSLSLPGTSYVVGQISRGGTCVAYDNSPGAAANPSSSLVGLCSGGTLVTGQELTTLIGGGGGNGNGNGNGNGGGSGGGAVTISNGKCTFSGSTIPPGIYYCDGAIDNQSQINVSGVTLIARDNMVFGAQTNLTPFLTSPNASSNTITQAANSLTRIQNLSAGTAKTAALAAAGTLSNVVLVAGADIAFTGNNTNITGIILAHNEINMTGGKSIIGYVVAGDGIPGFTGDPHPASLIAQPTGTQNGGSAITFNNVTGSNTITFKNFSTMLPLGAPAIIAWNDDQR